MRLIIFLIIGYSLFSCNKNDDPRISATITWKIGANIDGMTTMSESRSFNSEDAESLTFRIDSVSLCPFYGIRFVIEEDEEETYSEFFSDFPVEEEVDIEEDTEITVTSLIEDNLSNGSVCVWLGRARCEVSY